MVSTGIIRNVDPMGRIVLPIELRALFGIRPTVDEVSISLNNNLVILEKITKACGNCGSENDLTQVAHTPKCYLCGNCLTKFTNKRESLNENNTENN